MRLTKEEFCEAVNAFEKMYNEEHEILKALNTNLEWKPSSWINTFYDFLVKMCDLEETTDFGNDLDYYCFELDFGKAWKPGMIYVDEKEFPCRNAEELWSLIMKE